MVLGIRTPPEPVLRWAADQMGMGASVIGVQGLKDGAHPWLLRIRHAGQMTQAVLRLGDPDHPEWLATEAAALALAKDHNLAAPRLLGVDLVGPAGMPAVLMTVLPGTSRIPAWPRPSGFGQWAPPLPRCTRCRSRRDLWQGNSMWSGEEFVGVVDWDQAGAGHPGVDLGWLRFDAAILYGADAPAEILDGWRDASGREPDAVAYWDAAAALCSPADMADWLAVFHREGRTDLNVATLNRRRDAFLRQALEKLDGR